MVQTANWFAKANQEADEHLERLEARIYLLAPNREDAERVIAMCWRKGPAHLTLKWAGNDLASGVDCDEICYALWRDGAVLEERFKTRFVDEIVFFK